MTERTVCEDALTLSASFVSVFCHRHPKASRECRYERCALSICRVAEKRNEGKWNDSTDNINDSFKRHRIERRKRPMG